MTNSPTLQFGLLHSPPGDYVASLKREFPDVQFIVPAENGDLSTLSGIQAALAWGLDAETLDACPGLRWVQWVGAGVEQAPLAELQRRGIVLTNNRGVHAPNIAEHVLAMMLAFTRQLPALLEAQSRRQWLHWNEHESLAPIGELQRSTLLVLGAGNIGAALAARAEALGMIVTVVGRSARQTDRDVLAIEQLDDVLPLADHVAICLPLTAETDGLFNAKRFSAMKRGARLYNIGRGPIVDTQALTEALLSGHLGGAGLDVSDPEPLPSGHPLWDAPNLILTSHTSGITPRYWDRAYPILAGNLRRFLAGEALNNIVDLERGY